MKASEARELTKGSIKRKQIFFRAKIAWLCGRLNSKIENNAELGQSDASLDNIKQRTAKLYFPLMAKYYEQDEYFVCYKIDYYYSKFIVIWNMNKIPKDLYCYDYYTKENKK